jgi:hypothetical protein
MRLSDLKPRRRRPNPVKARARKKALAAAGLRETRSGRIKRVRPRTRLWSAADVAVFQEQWNLWTRDAGGLSIAAPLE